MTEDEAKQKYCPFVPLSLAPNGVPLMTSATYGYPSGSAGYGAFSYAAPVRQYTCQGSACMMWGSDGCGLVRR